MSVHKDFKWTDEDLLFWQSVWKFLVLEDFTIIPDNLSSNEVFLQLNKRTFAPSCPGFGIQILDSFGEVPTLLNNLQKDLFLHNYKVNYLQWNYLGKHEEKENYLSYLSEIFWNNQDHPAIQTSEDLLDLTENNWKVARLINSFDFYIHQPYDFFTPDTIKFVSNLENTLTVWELNPYLICNNIGSFHWQLLVNDKYSIEGFIYKESEYLIHQFEFKNLRHMF